MEEENESCTITLYTISDILDINTKETKINNLQWNITPLSERIEYLIGKIGIGCFDFNYQEQYLSEKNSKVNPFYDPMYTRLVDWVPTQEICNYLHQTPVPWTGD